MKDKITIFIICALVGGSFLATAIYAKTHDDPLALVAWFLVALLLCSAGG